MKRFAAALAAVCLTVLPGGVVGGRPACAAAEGDSFAIAVDFNGEPGAPSNSVTCVPVDGDDTAADALAKRARMLGRPAPTYNNAGLLCSLDGFPQSGCGERTAAGYRYWSYWFGGDSWTYASTGPAFHRASPGGSVGWRFQPNGAANASDPPPRFPSRHADLCPAAEAASAPTTAPRAPSSPPASATPPTSTTLASTQPRSLVPAQEPASVTSTTTARGADADTADSDDGGDVDQLGEAQSASPDERSSSERDSGAPLAIGALGVAAALGGAAAVKARRR